MFDLEAGRAQALVVLCPVLGMLVASLYLKTLSMHCVLAVNKIVKLLFKYLNELFLFKDVHVFSLNLDLLLDLPTFNLNVIEPINLSLKLIKPINNFNFSNFVLVSLKHKMLVLYRYLVYNVYPLSAHLDHRIVFFPF